MPSQDLKIKLLFDKADEFLKPLRKGMSEIKGMKKGMNIALQDSMRSIRKMQSILNTTDALDAMRSKVSNTAIIVKTLQQREMALQKIASKGAKNNKAQYLESIKQLPTLRADLRKTMVDEQKLISKTERLETRLQEAGVDTKNLADSQKQLQQSLIKSEDKLDEFGGGFQQAQLKMARYQSTLKKLRSTERDLANYSRLQQKYDRQRVAIKSAVLQHKELMRRQVSGAKATERHAQALDRAAAKVNKLTNEAKQQKLAFKAVGHSLSNAGLETKSLANAQAVLERRFSSTNEDISKQERLLLKLTAADKKAAAASREHARAQRNARLLMKNRQQSATNAMMWGAGTMYAGKNMMSKVLSPMQGAIDDEVAFAGVKKVVSFTDNDEAQAFRKELATMASTELPVATEGLYAIAEAGGQLGVKKPELKDFTRVVAVMSTAFDMSAEKAGTAMAKISKIYQLPISDMEEIGDVINHLSNNTTAKANEMVETLGRIGGISKGFGLTVIQSAALADSFLALGKTPETAATGINALLLKMQTATLQSKSFQQGLDAIGMDAESLEQSVGKDAQSALSGFLETLEKLPKENQMKVIGRLFGAEYADDISALVGGLKEYKKALALVSDSEKYDFSMQEEFETIQKTTKSQMTILDSQLGQMGNTLGYALLPVLNDLILSVRPMIRAAMDWADENPELTRTLLEIAIAGAGLMVVFGSIAVAIAVLRMPMAVLSFAFSALHIKTVFLTAATWLWRTAMLAVRAVALAGMLASMATSMGISAVATRGLTAALWLQRGAMVGLRAVALVGMLATMATSFGVAAGAAGLLNIALWAGATAMAILTSPITLVITAVALLAVGFYYLYTRWDEVQSYLQKTGWGRAILYVINALLAPFKFLYHLFLDTKNAWGLVTAAFADTNWAKGLLNIISRVQSAISSMSAKWTAAKKMVGGKWQDMKMGVSSRASKAWQSVRSIFGDDDDDKNTKKPLEWVNKVPNSYQKAANDETFNHPLPQVVGATALQTQINTPVTPASQVSAVPNIKKVQVSIGDINVHPSAGMDETQLAEKVRSVIQEVAEDDDDNSALYDTE